MFLNMSIGEVSLPIIVVSVADVPDTNSLEMLIMGNSKF